MNWEQLIAVFTLLNEPYDRAYVAAPPTEASVAKINNAFNITLPDALIRFARDCPSYGTWFASIGPDYESYLHILALNSAFRADDEFGNNGKILARLPPNLVMINHGHDGDCDCLEIGTFDEEMREFRIRHWRQYDGQFSGLLWPTFHQYLEWHLGNWTQHTTPEIRSRVDKALEG